jgi:hypothetical protein
MKIIINFFQNIRLPNTFGEFNQRQLTAFAASQSFLLIFPVLASTYFNFRATSSFAALAQIILWSSFFLSSIDDIVLTLVTLLQLSDDVAVAVKQWIPWAKKSLDFIGCLFFAVYLKTSLKFHLHVIVMIAYWLIASAAGFIIWWYPIECGLFLQSLASGEAMMIQNIFFIVMVMYNFIGEVQ